MTAAPTKRERHVLDVLARGEPLPASEFNNVGEATLVAMMMKGWIDFSRRQPDNRVVYFPTEAGKLAGQG